MLEEVDKLISPGPVGAAKLEEEDEMAKVASRIEELEGNFMIKKEEVGEWINIWKDVNVWEEMKEGKEIRKSFSGKRQGLYTWDGAIGDGTLRQNRNLGRKFQF